VFCGEEPVDLSTASADVWAKIGAAWAACSLAEHRKRAAEERTTTFQAAWLREDDSLTLELLPAVEEASPGFIYSNSGY